MRAVSEKRRAAARRDVAGRRVKLSHIFADDDVGSPYDPKRFGVA
jgi:hypothetical protein